MNFKSVLIITYGRSGSTLLQGLLNSIDGCIVRGENYNFCYGLFLAYQSLIKTKLEFGKKGSLEVTSPWYGAALYDEQRYITDARTLVLNQLLQEGDGDIKCYGFKEIRYLPGQYNISNFASFLDFLAKLFPDPAFIVLTRNHDQVCNSAWWKNRSPQEVKQSLSQFEKKIGTYSQGKNFVFSIDYHDMTERTPKLQQLFEFIGAPYREDKVAQVLSTPHSCVPKIKTFQVTSNRAKKISSPLKHTKVSCPELAHFSLDKSVVNDDADGKLTLTGVAVLQPNAIGEYRLLAVTTTGENPISWGRPSPKMADKYPASPNASASRFKSEPILKGKGEDILQLCLINEKGERHLLAEIKAADRVNSPVIWLEY